CLSCCFLLGLFFVLLGVCSCLSRQGALNGLFGATLVTPATQEPQACYSYYKQQYRAPRYDPEAYRALYGHIMLAVVVDGYQLGGVAANAEVRQLGPVNRQVLFGAAVRLSYRLVGGKAIVPLGCNCPFGGG